MSAAAHPMLGQLAPMTEDALRVFGQEDAPAVEVRYAPPSRIEFSQLFDPSPADVVRHLCRHLERGPDEWVPVMANRGLHEKAQAWVCVPDEDGDELERRLGGAYTLAHPPVRSGRRLAIVNGMSAGWLDVERRILIARGWMPGRNREVVQ